MEGVQVYFEPSELQELVEQARDYAVCHGVVLRNWNASSGSTVVNHAPFTLLPSPVPRTCFQLACQVQTDFNLLMHKVAHDHAFLTECLHHTIRVDGFTRRLWHIYDTVRKEGITQPVSLAMNRSDYMFDCGIPSEKFYASKSLNKLDSIQLKQVEFNTIAAGLGGLSSQMTKTHRYILSCLGIHDLDNRLPVNTSVDGLAEGLVTAWQQYGNQRAVILFLVLNAEWNIYDQRHLEYAVKVQNPKIKIVRRSLKDISQKATLNEDKALCIEGDEAAVVYMRTCYAPENFEGEEEWNTRLLIERSRAIKCPTIFYHLAGTKKVQQVLANPGILERFLDDPQVIARLRKTFVGQYSFDQGGEGDKIAEMAVKNPMKFVLKPQREGGGSNLFGADIVDKLTKLGSSKERNAYILMDRIYPTPLKNFPIKVGSNVRQEDMVSELGIFGVTVGTADTLILNKQQGFLLRTKITGTDEGGFARGNSAIDSPFLI